MSLTRSTVASAPRARARRADTMGDRTGRTPRAYRSLASPSSGEGQPVQHGHGVLRGTVLDHRYRIGVVIAHGGMATGYRGVVVRLVRPAAVKVMHTA